jgi:hypothetical protein
MVKINRSGLEFVILLFFITLLSYFVLATAGDGIKIISPATGNNYSSSFLINVSYINVTDVDTPAFRNTTCYINSSGSWVAFSNSTPYNISINAVFFNVSLIGITNGIGSINCTLGNSSTFAYINSTNMSTIRIDTISPNVSATLSPVSGGNYSQNLLINVTVNDITTSVSSVFFNITNSSGSQVNMTYASKQGTSNYWNATINTTSLSDGIYNLTVYANDSLNNLNSSIKTQFTVDNNPPVITLISPNGDSSVYTSWTFSYQVTDVLPSNCSLILDGNIMNFNPSADISGNTNTFTNSTGLGIHSWQINCTDFLSFSSVSSTNSFTITPASGNGPGGSSEVSIWTSTQVLSYDQFNGGFTKDLAVKNRFKFIVDNQEHSVGVVDLTSTQATINISSDSQQVIFNVGDEKKFELTGDSYYDLIVKLNSISDNGANVTVKSTHELVSSSSSTASNPASNQTSEATPTTPVVESSSKSILNSVWFWVISLIIILIILALIYFYYSRKKYYRKGYSKKWN